MAAPADTTPKPPLKWYYPVIGLVFAILVMGSVGIAAAQSDGAYEPGSHGAEETDDGHAEDTDDDGH